MLITCLSESSFRRFLTNQNKRSPRISYLMRVENTIKKLYGTIFEKPLLFSFPAIYRALLLLNIYTPRLKEAYLEITNVCNLRCKMCIYQRMQRHRGRMSRELFRSCVDQLSDIGIDTLWLHFGGESLLHPDFKEFLEYAIHQRNLGKIGRVCWVDNGMLFNKKMADLVISSKVDLISFSLDGVRQVNDKIRLGSDYSAIEKNIKYLLDKRGEEDKPEIRLSMCDYGKNEEEELEVYREWTPFVDGITLIPSIRFDNTIENKEGLQRLETLGPPPFCIFPFDTLAIGWDGKVTGCCLDYVFKMVLGDATKESIKEIWRGKKFQALRKAALTNSFPVNSPCSKCEFWKLNFQRRQELILNGKAKIEYSYIYRKIKKV